MYVTLPINRYIFFEFINIVRTFDIIIVLYKNKNQ